MTSVAQKKQHEGLPQTSYKMMLFCQFSQHENSDVYILHGIYYNYYTHLTAFFQDNLGKPASEK